jgi:hypothetical protein
VIKYANNIQKGTSMKIVDYEFHAKKEREKYEAIAKRIIDVLTSCESDVYRMCDANPIVILCGMSGSGKTRSIEIANERLPKHGQIAECSDILNYKDAEGAMEALPPRYQDAPGYPNCKYIVYSLLDTKTGRAVAMNYPGVKVIFCENP